MKNRLKKENLDLPLLQCVITNNGDDAEVVITISMFSGVDEAVGLVRKLRLPLATAITEYYNYPPPHPEEFDTYGDLSSSIH